MDARKIETIEIHDIHAAGISVVSLALRQSLESVSWDLLSGEASFWYRYGAAGFKNGFTGSKLAFGSFRGFVPLGDKQDRRI